ncbi:Spc42 protein [Maudiozyma humilis]|uniref:Spc42 protein n=1 Tax=Maudiozyma humilis TaxID=51915 RepID=A0AAV5RQN1_MAUHU|nr:Spc42 protein [Kazachstania humilis]
MNISPTPRRYTSRGSNSRNGLFDNNDRYQYSDPVKGNNAGRAGLYGAKEDVFLVPDYKKSSETWESLSQANIRLKRDTARLEDRVETLQRQNQEFREKLWKYTEKSDRLQQELDRLMKRQPERSFSVDRGMAPDTLNIPRSRARSDSNGDMYREYPVEGRRTKFATSGPEVTMFQKQQAQKIEELTASVAHLTRIISESKEYTPVQAAPVQASTPAPVPAQTSVLNPPSDNDILVRESMELEALERQVQQVQERLNIKEANEQRKASLKQTLSELLKQIDKPAAPTYTAGGIKKQYGQQDENFPEEARVRSKTKDRFKTIDPATVFGTPTSEFP